MLSHQTSSSSFPVHPMYVLNPVARRNTSLLFFSELYSKHPDLFGTIEHFNLGPLTVRGATQADPVADLEVSKSTQKVLIDGAVEI